MKHLVQKHIFYVYIYILIILTFRFNLETDYAFLSRTSYVSHFEIFLVSSSYNYTISLRREVFSSFSLLVSAFSLGIYRLVAIDLLSKYLFFTK